MAQIIRKGQQLEVVFKCLKCQTEFICDTNECTSEKNEKNPNQPFYCYDCPNCNEKCSTIYVREKGMSDLIEKNNIAIETNLKRQRQNELDKIMRQTGGYL